MTETLSHLQSALAHRYQVERPLGEGGMAVVYLAHDLKHDRPVAVKVLRPELAGLLGPERFLREIHIAAQLNHPHILGLHDSGEAGGLLYYVMPYVEGDSLRRRLQREGPLPVEEAVRIAAELADGLAYAHDLGVIHRDMKPENVLLSHGHAAIADFGIARAVAGADASLGAGRRTTTGISLGTPSYMSPEQALGDPAIDHRADIYSLGCVLYEMLTGTPPYDAPNAQALVVAHATAPLPSSRAHRHEVSFALDEAVRRAMAKEPTKRFQTAGELRDVLLEIIGPEHGRTRRHLAYAFVRRRLRLLGPIAVAVVAALGGYALLKRRAPPQVEAQRRLRVVVRYLEDRTGHSRATADRITEALTARLQSVPALEVPASALVAELRSAPIDSLRARFAPDRLVLGRFEESHGAPSVTVQIVDATSGRELAESTVLAARTGDPVTGIAEPISVFVRHAFWNDLENEARRARVRDAQAWDLVERARALSEDAQRAIMQRLDGQGFRSLQVSDSLLREARHKDQSSDLVVVDLAENLEQRAFNLEFLGQAIRNLPANLPRPIESRRQALAELEALLRARRARADAFELRGRIREGLWRELHADSLLEGAIADFRTATELDRQRATAWSSLGSAYMSAGRTADALLAIEHAEEEDVFQLHRPDLLRMRYDAALRSGRFDVAEAACHEGVSEAPQDMRFEDCDVQLWSRTRGDRRSAAAARARVDSLAALEPPSLFSANRELWVAEILARAGLGDSSDRIARLATASAPPAWQPLLFLESAYLRTLRRDPDSALALISEAARRDPTARRYIRSTPDYESLRADPRFERAAAGNLERPTRS